MYSSQKQQNQQQQQGQQYQQLGQQLGQGGLGLGQGGQGGLGGNTININNNDYTIQSPLSASVSASGHSPFGTPGSLMMNFNTYSMSMPVQGSASNAAAAMHMHDQSLGTSFGSYTSQQLQMSSQSIENNTATAGDVIDGRMSVDAINEKRRKRRESHNAVERRRRDLINDKISELSSLLPEYASDANNKPNKGLVLNRSVEYIRHMQLFAARQMDRTLELEQCLMRLCLARGIDEKELGLSVPLGSTIQLPQMATSISADDMASLDE